MKLDWPVEIAGTGACIPSRVMSNADFTRTLDTTDEWIVQRTGIRERRIVAEGQSTLDLAATAGRAAIADAGMTAQDIDLIVNCTITPEHVLPSTACELQHALGCRWVGAFDLVAACSGFVFGVITAAQYVVSGMAKNVLVVGAESLTRITDFQDRASCILFGDGAGAAVVRPSTDLQRRLLAANMGADGARARAIWVPGGGAAEPASLRTVNERLHYMRMNGREIYKFAVTQMQQLVAQTTADAGCSVDDLALLVPHQSNLRIIESACERLGLPASKVLINIDRYGNTSAASVPIALHEARVAGRVRPGDLVMLVAFGAGLTWGSVLLRV
jgi:3-oxoacyl-[acyl-carrier-protein] synthase-3